MNLRRRSIDRVTHGNQDRWLVSYADFVTLLFAFFVVMFASSQTDTAKMRALSKSVHDAFEGHARTSYSEGADELTRTAAALDQSLTEEIAAQKISITLENRGLVISLQESAFFPSGGDTLLPAATPSINKIAAIIGRLPNAIRLEGHTDSIPIKNGRFASNWELSAARGISVLKSFHTGHGIDMNRMAVVAYADTMPKESNDTEEGRASNRRVDVTVLNESGSRQEAKQKSDGN